MGNIITDLRNRFLRADIALRFIYVNVAVFLLTALADIVMLLTGHGHFIYLRWAECPADFGTLLRQPWSLVTYMFLHADVWHILFNMLWLYWFGRLFLYLFSDRHFRGLYFLGGLCGGVLYMLAYNVFPYFQTYIHASYLLGASASVLAIAVATAVREPDYRVNLLFLGSIRLKYLALILVVTDLLFITSSNGGGHIAHLGGALAGWWFAASFQRRYDPTEWINRVIDFLTGLFTHRQRTRRRPKMKVHYSKHAADYDYNARKREREEEIGRILDKLKKSGYDSLTNEEKKKLFDESKR